MASPIWGKCAYCAAWWIRRNPTYLLSAACMALGARLYLVEPRTRAGDMGVILLTLGVLQLYEWAVTAILLMLHRRRRSPEDEPSLLLVATLFWTGPLAATREMAVHWPHLGLVLALGACAIALAEMRTVTRRMNLRISRATRLIACTCLVLLAISPPLLIVPKQADGTNEIYLYFTWWLLAIITLAGLGTMRAYPLSAAPVADLTTRKREFRTEMAFLAITLAVTIAHLEGMNYAFFCHSRWFYASPLIIVIGVLITEYLAQRPKSSRWLVAAAFVLPGAAIALARSGFDQHVPIRALPVFLQDPLLMILIPAGIAWWFSYRRLGHTVFLHAGSLAMAWAAYQALPLFRPDATTAVSAHMVSTGMPRDLITLLLYAIVVYLLLLTWWRRSRLDALAALIVHQAAFVFLVLDRSDIDMLLILIVAGWSWLAGLHIAVRRPALSLALWPICLLVFTAWGHDFSEPAKWIARTHAVVMVAALVLAGMTWPWTRYRLAATGVAAADIAFYFVKWTMTGKNPAAAGVVLVSFVLLIAGAFIGWHKGRLLGLFRRPEPTDPRADGEGECAVFESE
jgi:hypothetical protein